MCRCGNCGNEIFPDEPNICLCRDCYDEMLDRTISLKAMVAIHNNLRDLEESIKDDKSGRLKKLILEIRQLSIGDFVPERSEPTFQFYLGGYNEKV